MTDLRTERAPAADRYQMLDVWRGVVSLVVVLEHAGAALWGGRDAGSGWEGALRQAVVTALGWNLGTPLFFVMSGYCVAAGLVASRRKGVGPAGFLGRRLWRIFPTYWAAVLGIAAFVAAADAAGLARLHSNGLALEIGSPFDLSRPQWLGNLTLTETWRPLVGGGEAVVFNRVAWSLCYQEQFYVVCVLALWLAPRRLGRCLAAVTAVVVLFRVEAWDLGFLHRVEGLFPVYWHEFAVGLALYWRLTGAGAWDSAARRRALELFVAGVLAVGCFHGNVSAIASSAFALVLIAAYRWDGRSADFAWLDPIRAIGRRSYSIYLTHLPVVALGNDVLGGWGLSGFWVRVFVLLPAVTALSVGFGWAFHHAVERRFMAPPRWPRPRLGARDGPRVVPA